MNSVYNSNDVTFGAGAVAYEGAVGASDASMRPLGMLGRDVPFNAQQTTLQKKDGFPQQVVAEAVSEQAADISLVLHEINVENLALMYGLEAADLVAAASGDVPVTNEPKTFSVDGVIVLDHAVKLVAGVPTPTPVVTNVGGSTTYVPGTDYIVVPRDYLGRTVIYRLSTGAIPAQGAVEVDYTWSRPASVTLPIGLKNTKVYRRFRLEEALLNGKKQILVFPKASFTINGNLTFNAVSDTSASLAVKVTAVTLGGSIPLFQHILEG